MLNDEWLRFSWRPEEVKAFEVAVSEQYQIRPAEKSDLENVRKVISSAFTLDSEWRQNLKGLVGGLLLKAESAFEERDIPALVLTHGTRAIGASLFDLNPACANHLLTGPILFMEYRNRGLGSRLLKESLLHMGTLGIEKVSGVTLRRGEAARYVYPKFGAEVEIYVSEQVPLAS